MLDEYVWGDARRISPEAPVPVIEVQRRSYSTGGAANVAANIGALGGRALLCGLIGHDLNGEALKSSLLASGVETSGLHVDGSRPTTTKTRIMAQNHQIARLDAEDRTAPSPALLKALLNWIEQAMTQTDACVISDYAKGVVTTRLAQHVLRLAERAGKPVVVDPKARDFRHYRGASVITPNIQEACRAANCEPDASSDLERLGRRLVKVLRRGAVLLTRGADGMSLFASPEAAPLHIPAEARSVFDVTGAGDTVVSTLALALAAGDSIEDAARLANRAAGIVVGKLGAASVAPDELFSRIAPPLPPGAPVLRAFPTTSEIRSKLA